MWALIEDSKVREITDVDPKGRFHESMLWVACGNDVMVGFSYDNGVFLNDADELLTNTQRITMRQARLMLHRNGLLSGVQSAINSLEEPQKTEAQIEWDYAQTVDRDNPIMKLLANALGLSDPVLDEMFLEASKL